MAILFSLLESVERLERAFQRKHISQRHKWPDTCKGRLLNGLGQLHTAIEDLGSLFIQAHLAFKRLTNFQRENKPFYFEHL